MQAKSSSAASILTPMGSSISPVKAAIALSECERVAITDKAAAAQWELTQGDESPSDVISGVRLADDITLVSKMLCTRCMEK